MKPIALLLLLASFALAEDARYAQPQPQGALSGKRVYLSPGHGYYWDETYGWTTQRGTTFGLIEDIHTCEIVSDYLAKYLYNAGATAFVCRERCKTTAEFIVDNSSAGYSDSGGFATTTNAGTGYGDGLYRYVATSATETATARWSASISTSAWYSIYVYYVASSNRVTDATYRVNHAGGSTEVRMNQRIDGSRWLWLGEYWFEAGSMGSVELSNRSGQSGVVIADAVRFGGGMGSLVRNGRTSGQARWRESARYWLEFMGAPSSVYQTRSTDRDSDVTCRPEYADWQGGDAYVSLHTNAAGGTGTDTFIHDTAPSPGSSSLQRTIHTQLIADIRAGWDSAWTDRGMKTANFGEVRECDTMPAVLIELAFHDRESPDNDYLHEDDFRQLSARAIYKGIVRYFDPNAVILPVAPTHFRVRNMGSGQVRLSWRRALDPREPSAAPTGYRVYRSRNGKGFEDGVAVASTAADVSWDATGLAPGQTYYFRVSATNAGGESFPTETLAVRVGNRSPVLLVSGFDRVDRNVRFRDGHNTFDYVRQHAQAIASAPGGVAFDSATNEAVRDGLVRVDPYEVIDWILGEESTRDETFSPVEQSIVSGYLTRGGALLLSGSEVAWDLGAQGAAQDVAFLRDVLRATYVADAATRGPVDGAAGSVFAGLSDLVYDDGTRGWAYNVDSPDAIAPAAEARVCLTHRATGQAAGVQWAGYGRLLYLAVPIEAFEPGDRAALMGAALGWLLERPRSREQEVVVGLGRTGYGRFLEFDGSRGVATHWTALRWAEYNRGPGEVRVSCGDVDGDGRDEFVVGIGSYPSNGGFVEVVDDAGGGYAHLAWLRFGLGPYNAADGQTETACGDVDGDGRAEVIVAPGPFRSNGGWFQVFDDARAGFAPVTWLRVPDAAYNAADGRVHPACGNLDGDAADEVIAGVGPYPSNGGRIFTFDNAPGFAPLGVVRVPWLSYNQSNGETRPALADLDGDGRDELLVGMGSYPSTGGLVWVADDASAGFATLGWPRFRNVAYNAADGQTWVSAGDADGDGDLEIAVGMGPYPADGGWIELFGGPGSGFGHIRWMRVPWERYRNEEGSTRPAFGQVH